MREPSTVARSHPVPRALIEAYGQVWVALHGGRVEALDVGFGRCYVWYGPRGEREALPGRMYGLTGTTAKYIDATALPAGVTVHLPPGVSADGAVSELVTHVLSFEDLGQAWEALRRVGRQGVKKAERAGCCAEPLSDEAFHQLACLKSEAHGAPPADPRLSELLRATFGDAFGVTGILLEGTPVAAVSWVVVERYAMFMEGVSDRRFWGCNPNNLAVWRAIEDVAARGASWIDYGFSPTGSGDGRFKDHMGGRSVPLYRVGPEPGATRS